MHVHLVISSSLTIIMHQQSNFTAYLQQCNNNECTKVQNPRYKDVTLNAYTSA